MRTVPKALRHRRILDLIVREAVLTQEELVDRLAKAGLHVTQATLSRDIKELGLVKTPEGYSTPGELAGEAAPAAPPLSHLLLEFVVEVKEAQNLLVIRTTAGSAQPVAAALDADRWPELLGTLAGDDTILVVAASVKQARELGKRIRELMA
ncbi:MAG: arginine repressor [Terriglobales bacterium]